MAVATQIAVDRKNSIRHRAAIYFRRYSRCNPPRTGVDLMRQLRAACGRTVAKDGSGMPGPKRNQVVRDYNGQSTHEVCSLDEVGRVESGNPGILVEWRRSTVQRMRWPWVCRELRRKGGRRNVSNSCPTGTYALLRTTTISIPI